MADTESQKSTATPLAKPLYDSGPIPTIVTGDPPRRIVRPTRLSSAPKRVRHAGSGTTATGPAVATSSSEAIQRPRATPSPSTGKYDEVANSTSDGLMPKSVSAFTVV